MSGLKIAIPNKGRLSEDVLELLQRAGLTITKQESRKLYAKTQDGNYTIIFVRTQDIPSFVNDGVTDLGVTGYDVVKESELEVDEIMKLNFGGCKLIVATKEESPYNSPEDIPDGTKIATSFPNLTKRFFEKLGKKVHVIEVTGATEVTPQLGLADVITDITSSGSTLRSNKLKIIGEILDSTCMIIGRPGILESDKEKIQTFCTAVNSALAAEEKKYLMAHVPKSSLEKIKAFLPGLSSPTVISLLDDNEHVVIHVVVEKYKIHDSVDNLKKLGASGILIMTVDQMIA